MPCQKVSHDIFELKNVIFKQKTHDTTQNSQLILLDGLSIICILLFHELGGINSGMAIFLSKYLVCFGLVSFTFSSGYKLILSHRADLSDKQFLGNYFLKRFVRLYKPYIGYTLLMFMPLLLLMYLAKYYFRLNIAGVSSFWNSLTIRAFFNLLVGNNLIADQLWYLVALLVITAVVFSILYLSNLRLLFFCILPLVVFDFAYWGHLMIFSNMLFNIMVYMPVFIFGMLYAYAQKLNGPGMACLTYLLSALFLLLFVLSIYFPENAIFRYNVLIYGFTTPCFILSVLPAINVIKSLQAFLLICGSYSFQIYLLQWPLVLPVLSRLIIDILGIRYSIMPYLVVLSAIFVCIVLYRILVRLKINVIFE
jgi:peptidoglycan/LPS O-acetylase OafA/YrhL